MAEPIASNKAFDRSRLRLIAALLILFAVGWANWRQPVLRFTSPSLNIAVFCILLLAPTIAAVLAFRLRSVKLRRLIGLPLVPVAGMAALLAALSTSLLVTSLKEGKDPSMELVRTVSQKGYALRIYRTNGGATTGYGALVRQERVLLPGILVVRNVHHSYPAEEARIEQVRPNEFVFDERPAEVRVLKSWVWF